MYSPYNCYPNTFYGADESTKIYCDHFLYSHDILGLITHQHCKEKLENELKLEAGQGIWDRFRDKGGFLNHTTNTDFKRNC